MALSYDVRTNRLTQPKTVMIASSRDDIIEKQFTKLGLEFPVVVKKLEASIRS